MDTCWFVLFTDNNPLRAFIPSEEKSRFLELDTIPINRGEWGKYCWALRLEYIYIRKEVRLLVDQFHALQISSPNCRLNRSENNFPLCTFAVSQLNKNSFCSLHTEFFSLHLPDTLLHLQISPLSLVGGKFLPPKVEIEVGAYLKRWTQ